MPARDKISCGDTLFRLTCSPKLSVRIWELFHFSLSKETVLLFNRAHRVNATCRAYHARASICRSLEEKTHFLSLDGLFSSLPYKAPACGCICGVTLKHQRYTSMTLTLAVVYKQSCSLGKTPCSVISSDQQAACKHNPLTHVCEVQTLSQIFLALLTGKGRHNHLEQFWE